MRMEKNGVSPNFHVRHISIFDTPAAVTPFEERPTGEAEQPGTFIHHAARVAFHGRFNSQTFSFAGAFPFSPPGTSAPATRVSAYVDA